MRGSVSANGPLKEPLVVPVKLGAPRTVAFRPVGLPWPALREAALTGRSACSGG